MLEMHNIFGMDEVELFVEQVPIDLQMNSPIGNCMPLLLGENDGTSNVQNPFTFEHRLEEDEEEGSSPFLAIREAIEREQMRYVADLDDPIELSPMQYHLAPSPQFENVENIGHVMSSEWTPWGNTLMGHPIGEFIVGQIFNSKGDLQHAVKMYSINSHQEYIVLSSTKKLLVLRCKKVEQSQCPWRLRATVVKGTSLFEINKYSGPHTCVNPCMNQDHHQLDSNLIAAHIEGMIKTQFTLSVVAIQASVVERFGYHISYTKASKGKRKALTNLFGDFYKSYAKLPHFFGALKQTNPGCVVISKTFPGNMRNEEVFQRVFWAFHPSIEGFKHCRHVLTIDGTRLYGKYKGIVMIAMGCDGNNQLFPLAFALTEACIRNRITQRRGLCVISDRHQNIMAAFADVYLGWSEPNAYHRICMRHHARNFMTHFKDKCLKQLLCRAALETKLEAIPFEKWALSHDGGRRYGIMTTNMSEVFNSVLKGARSFPITAFVQLTFYRVNSYFVVRREHGASRLASGKQYTPYVDAKINANVVKAGSHEVVLYDHFQGLFHVKASRGSKKTSSHGCTCGKTLIYGFPCSHILVACHFRSIDFRSFVQHYYTIQSYFSTWPPYVGRVIVHADSMKRVSGGRPKSTRLHNEMGLNQVLACRQRLWTFMREWEMDPRIRRYVIQSGFYGVYRVGHISLDWPLITSLIERWRPETHTFHLPIGEMTVTLQDVAMILGLRIHGPSITGTCDIDWSQLCSELLGVVPPPSHIRGSSISARWLREQFSYPPVGVDDVILQRYTRAFILALLGGALFADKTGTHVQLCYLPLLRDFTEISHYSWGSAVLAYLYRELCHASLDSATEISGPITLLQLWSWERLHVGRPDFDRPPVPIVVPHLHDDVVDGLHDHLLPDEALPVDPLGHRWRVLWEPYTADLIAHIPVICQANEEIWQTIPERVLRQFRMQQGIPPPCLIDMELHLRIATTPFVITTMAFYDPYMQWYRHITRCLIAPVLHRDHMRFHSTTSATELLMAISNDLEETHRIAIDSSTSSGPSMRPPSLITPVRVPPIRDRGRGGRRAGHRHVPLASTLSIAPHHYESIAPPPVIESIAPLPFLQGITHAARLHVRVPKGHRVLPPSVPSNSTAHVDDVSQSIEMKTFQITQMDTTNMAIYRRCSQRKRKIPSCGTH
ncbi:hypothetical protein AAG906_003864 [Vitis piasezkii]